MYYEPITEPLMIKNILINIKKEYPSYSNNEKTDIDMGYDFITDYFNKLKNEISEEIIKSTSSMNIYADNNNVKVLYRLLP